MYSHGETKLYYRDMYPRAGILLTYVYIYIYMSMLMMCSPNVQTFQDGDVSAWVSHGTACLSLAFLSPSYDCNLKSFL